MKDKSPVEQLVLELCFCIPKKGCTSLVAGTSLFYCCIKCLFLYEM